MENGGSKKVWVWIGIIILIILIWWAMASKPADAPGDELLDADDTSALTIDNLDAIEAGLDDLDGLDTSDLDSELEDIDADLENL